MTPHDRIRSAHRGLLALVLGACLPAREPEVVTLQFWAMGREGEVVQELIPGFERRNPGIRVRVQQMPWTAAHEKLLTAYVGEATPDVAQLGNTWIPEMVALNALERLDSLVTGSALVVQDDFFPGIWETNLIGGGTYGIPWYVDTRLIFYRTDLLAKAGFSGPPESWAEWREAMRRIKEEVGGDNYAALLTTNEWQPPVILGLQAGSTLLRDGGRYGAFSAPEFRAAFEFYVDLFREGLAPPVSTNRVPNAYQAFADGVISMYLTGPWNIGEFRRRLPEAMQDRWMTAPMPGPTAAAPGVSVAGGSSLVMFAASAHRAEAWKLIEYLSAPEQQLRFYELTGDLPARMTAWQDPLLAENRYARAFWQQLQHVTPTPKVPEWEQVATKVLQYAEAAVLGKLSTEEALAALDRDVDRILEKRRWMLARKSRGKD